MAHSTNRVTEVRFRGTRDYASIMIAIPSDLRTESGLPANVIRDRRDIAGTKQRRASWSVDRSTYWVDAMDALDEIPD